MKKAKFILSFISFLSLVSCTPRTPTTTKPVTPTPRPNTSDVQILLPSSPSLNPISTPTPRPLLEDPEKIAFMSNRDGFWDVYAMNTDGSSQTRITNDDMKNPFAFSVSPDGKTLAYVSDKAGNPDIWVMNLDTKEVKQVTDTPNAEEGSPCWDSNGTNIAFHSNVNKTGFFEVLEVKYPLESTKKFETIVSDKTENIFHPSFSPDGQAILYSSVNDKGETTLYIYDYIKKKEVAIVTGSEQAINGTWDSNSLKVLYWTSSSGIFQVNKDGTGKIQVGTVKNNKGLPLYSPNSKKIVLSRGYGFSEDYNVWVMDSDGRNLKKLTSLGGISVAWFKNSKLVKPNAGETSNSNNNNNNGTTTFPSGSPTNRPYIEPDDTLLNP